MKNIIIKTLVAGSLISFVATTALYADQNQTVTIEQKAKEMVHNSKVKADKLIEDAKVKAAAIIEKTKTTVEALKNESEKSINETTQEAKDLAHEALEKSKATGTELIEKSKALPSKMETDIQDKYVYSKKAVNKSYEKGKDKANDILIHTAIKYAYLVSSDIHSMKIDIDVKDGVVELFGKVQSAEEAEKAIQIALSTKGVSVVNALFSVKE